MGNNQTHSAGAARSTKLPWGASDLKGHRQGVRKGLCPPPTVGPHEDPHLKVSTPAEESRRQLIRTLGQKLVRGEHRQPEEHEAGAGAFGKGKSLDRVELVNRVKLVNRVLVASQPDSTGRLPHQDGEEQ